MLSMFKVFGWFWRDSTQEERTAMLRTQTACDDPSAAPTSGLVAYVDDEPAGWVAVEQRTRTPSRPPLASRPGVAETMREALRQGTSGASWDNVCWIGRWDIDLSAVRCPVLLWYGSKDRFAPPRARPVAVSESAPRTA